MKKNINLNKQNKEYIIPISPSNYKLLLLYDLLIRLTKASHPGAKYEPPSCLEGLFALQRTMEENKISSIMNLPSSYSIKDKTPLEILFDIEKSLMTMEIQDEKLILTCLKCITDLIILKRDFEMTMTEDEFIHFMIIEDYVKARAYEALGYKAAKVKRVREVRDGAAKKKKDQGKANKEAIRKLIDEMEIKTFSVFRKDKPLRKNFFEKAKKITGLTSETRIYDIGRECLKEK